MLQNFLPGFPDGAIQITPRVCLLKKEGVCTYFVGTDNYFSHKEHEIGAYRMAIATLIHNRHARPVDVERSPLGIPHRTLMRWSRQLADEGSDSFFAPRRTRGGGVLTPEKIVECEGLFADGGTVAEVAREAGVNESTLRKAVAAGRVERKPLNDRPAPDQADTKSQRSRKDAEAAAGMGTACTRADERMAAAMGMAGHARARFEPCDDVAYGGLLTGLPALCANGLLSGLDRHLSLPAGYYSALHVLVLLGFMALARIRRPEGLRHVPPGELGRALGLDRVPEVRTLREKIGWMSSHGNVGAWSEELGAAWMAGDPLEAGYLYVDGHVRVYHGNEANLPRRYVSREKLCLRGTTDYWVNDALGRPFFVVSKPLTEGLGAALLEDIVPQLLEQVPGQPGESELAADPLSHRFVVIFDREGASHSLLSALWEQRIGAITYRKSVKDVWPEAEFSEVEVTHPGGERTLMRLAGRQSELGAGKRSMPVLEVRRLSESGHQTAIITTAMTLNIPVVAGRMFSRWCQENFFGYMMEHYDLDGLVQYGSEEIPGGKQVVNPVWRGLDKQVRSLQALLRREQARFGSHVIKEEGFDAQIQGDRLLEIQRLEERIGCIKAQRKETPRKVRLEELPEEERPTQLRPLGKRFTDTIKMIAYRAETAMVGLLKPHLAKEEEARALIRELFVSSADLRPSQEDDTLCVRVHRMASPVHDRAIEALLDKLNQENFQHPETGMKIRYELS
jgi:transposase-like protein